MLVGLFFVGTITTLISRHEGKGLSRQIRWLLLTLISGLILYNWYLLGLPFPARAFWEEIGGWTPPTLLTLGGGLSLLVLWWQQARR